MYVNGDFNMALTLSVVMALNGNRDSAKTVNRALGRRLAHFRKQRGYSQQELARRVGAVQVVISDYERGKLRLSAEMALRFATALDLPIQELLQTTKSVLVDAAPKPSRRLLRRLERIEHLPRRKQEALLTTIDAFLGNATGKAAS
jgi:transcriptional regulator with XRE-family HTH domain